MITSDGTTRDTSGSSSTTTTDENKPAEEEEEEVVESKTEFNAIFGSDKDLPVHADQLLFDEHDEQAEGDMLRGRPWEDDERFAGSSGSLREEGEGEGVQVRQGGQGGRVGKGGKVDEPKSPLEHEEVESEVEPVLSEARTVRGSGSPAAVESSSSSSSSTAAASTSAPTPAPSASLESGAPSSSSNDGGASSSNNGSSSGNNGNSPPGNSGNNGNSGGNNGGDAPPPKTTTGKEVAKVSIPDEYPQVLALPITRRPLFPGFYKAVTITSPPVIKAIRTLLQRGQPYIGAFLLKDSNADSDVITSPDQVYPVGVFAQITSVFGAGDGQGADGKSLPPAEGEEGKRESLTAVLYPHRRIRIDELLTQRPVASGSSASASVEGADKRGEVIEPSAPLSEVGKPEAEVASFELADVPTPEQIERDMHPKSGAGAGAGATSTSSVETPPQSHISFLHSMVPEISLTNVSNLELEPFNKDDQMIKAVMNELLSVFKDIAQLAPIFREQITSFTINQSSSNVFEDPDKLADFAAAVSSGDVQELQGVLESLSVQDRLQKALTILKKELINAQLQSKIARDVETKLHKRQREVYLMEQLKGIKKELGMDSDGKDKLVEGFKEKAGKLAMPEGVKTVFDEEINKLMHLEPAASEFKWVRVGAFRR